MHFFHSFYGHLFVLFFYSHMHFRIKKNIFTFDINNQHQGSSLLQTSNVISAIMYKHALQQRLSVILTNKYRMK